MNTNGYGDETIVSGCFRVTLPRLGRALAEGHSRMKLTLFALFITAFAIGTAEFVVAGLLPHVSADFGFGRR